MIRFVFFIVLLICVASCSDSGHDAEKYDWKLREGFPKPIIPQENPISAAKIELGRKLFYDKNLSANQTQSCASCHQQQFAFAEARITSIGSTGETIRR
ncbi:MAG: cytochrome-c peroxidase, partial [Kangiellaceae bacterium]|nr:cytochrome-c peroxidase [Kangiellaceae bacterium]